MKMKKLLINKNYKNNNLKNLYNFKFNKEWKNRINLLILKLIIILHKSFKIKLIII